MPPPSRQPEIFVYHRGSRTIARKGPMPASKKTSKPATKPDPAKPKPKAAAAEPAKPEPVNPEPAQAAAPKAPVKSKPQIPGKPEPSWAKFNQGGNHAQKMMKGRPFRHQGR